jgi:hypothetical protein
LEEVGDFVNIYRGKRRFLCTRYKYEYTRGEEGKREHKER